MTGTRSLFGARRAAFIAAAVAIVAVRANAQETRRTGGLAPEPAIISRAIDYANRTLGGGSEDGDKSGLYPEFSNMPTGSGWISAGPGYRYWFGDTAVVDASAAISWRSYKMARASVRLPELARGRLEAGGQAAWRDMTQITFFGTGPESLEAERSEYRMTTTDVVGYATYRPKKQLAIGGRVGWLAAPTLAEPAGSFDRGYPDAAVTFADDPVYTRGAQPAYSYGGISIVLDTRDASRYPSKGGIYRAAWTAYADRENGQFSHQQYETEAAHFVPVADRRVVFALHGWVTAISNTDAGAGVPFYLMPSLGGHNSVRGFIDYRFHDRHMAVANAEARLAVMAHIDLAAFADAGNVSPTLANLNLDKRAYGLGLRVHSARTTFARFDVAHGSQGWQVFFRTNDALHLSRLSRRLAAAPAVP